MRFRTRHAVVAALLLAVLAPQRAHAGDVVLLVHAQVADGAGRPCAGFSLVANGEHAAYFVATDGSGRCQLTLMLGDRDALGRAPRIVTLRSGNAEMHLVGRDAPEVALAIVAPPRDPGVLDIRSADSEIRSVARFRGASDTAEVSIPLRCAPGAGRAKNPGAQPSLGVRTGRQVTIHQGTEKVAPATPGAPPPGELDSHPGPMPPVRAPAGGGNARGEAHQKRGDCNCRIEGTIVVVGSRGIGEHVRIVVEVREAPRIAATIETRPDVARSFVLRGVPCGTVHLVARALSGARGHLALRGGDVLECGAGSTLRPRLTLMRRPSSLRD